MTKSVAFKTARGAEITITLVTETPNLADHTVMSPCWALTYHLNGTLKVMVQCIEHPEHGPCLKMSGATAPIPADALPAVDALLAEYRDGVQSRHDRWVEAETSPAARLSRRLSADMDRPDSDL